MKSVMAKKCKVKCKVIDCSYNTDGFCHAMSITIGDHGEAMCDTFYLSAEHVRENDVACVGACKVEDCIHNDGLLCLCKHIRVGRKDEDFYCLSYKAHEKESES